MLTELEPAAMAAVPLAEFAAHLRLPEGFASPGEEPGLETYARAASAAVEGLTGRALISRRFLWRVTRWRESGRARFPIAPVGALESVTQVDAQGDETVVPPGDCLLVTDAFAPVLKGAGRRSLPEIPEDGAVEVIFAAGHGAGWEDVPAALRQAVLLLGAQYYEQRHVSADPAREAPYGVQALIAPWREMRL